MADTINGYAGNVFSSPSHLLDLTKELSNSAADSTAKKVLFTEIDAIATQVAAADNHGKFSNLVHLLKLFTEYQSNPACLNLGDNKVWASGPFVLYKQRDRFYLLYKKDGSRADVSAFRHGGNNINLNNVIAREYCRFDREGVDVSKVAWDVQDILNVLTPPKQFGDNVATARKALDSAWTKALAELLKDEVPKLSELAAAAVDADGKERAFDSGELATFSLVHRLYEAMQDRSERPGVEEEIKRLMSDIRVQWRKKQVAAARAKYIEQANALLPNEGLLTNTQTVTGRRVMEVELPNGRNLNGIVGSNAWRFLEKVFSKDPKAADNTFAYLCGFIEDDVLTASEALRVEKEQELVRYLKMTLFGRDDKGAPLSAMAVNKFDLAIGAANPKVNPNNIALLSFGFRKVERFFSAQEAALFRTKLQLILARVDKDFVPNFQEFDTVFAAGQNLGSFNETLQASVQKTRQQITALTPDLDGRSAKFQLNRDVAGRASLVMPGAVAVGGPGLTLKRMDDIVGVLVSAIDTSRERGRLPAKWSVTVLPNAKWSPEKKATWIAEVVGSGFINVWDHVGTSHIPTDADKDVLRILVAGAAVAPAVALTIEGENPEDWRVEVSTDRGVLAKHWSTYFTTRYTEENHLSVMRSYSDRVFGLDSYLQDACQDMALFRPGRDGRPQDKYVSLVSSIKVSILDENGNVGENPIGLLWENDTEKMAILVKWFWNRVCKEFGLEYRNEYPDGTLDYDPAHINKARNVSTAGPDIEAIANAIELLRAIEEPYVRQLEMSKSLNARRGIVEKYMDLRNKLPTFNCEIRNALIGDLSKNTTFNSQEMFLRTYLHDNIDFTGQTGDGYTSIYGINGKSPEATTVGRFPISKGWEGHMIRYGCGRALTFPQQLALHRTQLLLSKAVLHLMTLPCAMVQTCTIHGAFTSCAAQGDYGSTWDVRSYYDEMGNFTDLPGQPKSLMKCELPHGEASPGNNCNDFPGSIWTCELTRMYYSLWYL
ncbi:MAG: hypothetical protein LBH53_00910, partial [Puniceicoccales bacterium]|nr:hypothetical protein [Puniceicoccales bacterium]